MTNNILCNEIKIEQKRKKILNDISKHAFRRVRKKVFSALFFHEACLDSLKSVRENQKNLFSTFSKAVSKTASFNHVSFKFGKYFSLNCFRNLEFLSNS